jgi:hypothetical protein
MKKEIKEIKVKKEKSVFEVLSTKDVSGHTRVLKVSGKEYSDYIF